MPFYVLNSQEYNGHHEVHDTQHTNQCTYPLPEHRIDLGFHANCALAVNEARLRYSQAVIDGCAFCTNCHTV